LLAAVLVPLLAVGYIGYSNVPTGFMPKVDEGGFIMDYFTRRAPRWRKPAGWWGRSMPC
jgi:multidrug efflux pump subunit AcrB